MTQRGKKNLCGGWKNTGEPWSAITKHYHDVPSSEELSIKLETGSQVSRVSRGHRSRGTVRDGAPDQEMNDSCVLGPWAKARESCGKVSKRSKGRGELWRCRKSRKGREWVGVLNEHSVIQWAVKKNRWAYLLYEASGHLLNPCLSCGGSLLPTRWSTTHCRTAGPCRDSLSRSGISTVPWEKQFQAEFLRSPTARWWHLPTAFFLEIQPGKGWRRPGRHRKTDNTQLKISPAPSKGLKIFKSNSVFQL